MGYVRCIVKINKDKKENMSMNIFTDNDNDNDNDNTVGKSIRLHKIVIYYNVCKLDWEALFNLLYN